MKIYASVILSLFFQAYCSMSLHIINGAETINVSDNEITVNGVSTGILKLQFEKGAFENKTVPALVAQPWKERLEGCIFINADNQGTNLDDQGLIDYQIDAGKLTLQLNDAKHILNQGGMLTLIDFYR